MHLQVWMQLIEALTWNPPGLGVRNMSSEDYEQLVYFVENNVCDSH